LREKEGAVLGVIKFTTVITLNKLNWQAKVCDYILSKVEKDCRYFRFSAKRKGPSIVRIIIQDHKIIFITRNTRDWRGP